ncbi:phage terminase large subunit family protein [Paracoccus limosus]|uniref:Phage terminase large subunit family protein n=1 Tax=Paracoccus limosus TaxID=913252 RepID=A0A844H7Z6_9RHOB|nr:phage terminase large subunit family protein [Paracoccus limosus]MTH35763.1 phage terminase large subunit family protein [Paracoccus limosus]
MQVEAIRAEALRALLPPPNVPLADWIESSVVIPASASALPGKMQLWPFQRGWCEAIEDPEIERITIQKGARIGYTQWLSATLAHFVANAPAPIIALQPTADDARDYSVELESLFEASPSLRGLLSDDADESGRSTMLARRFPGGSLKFLAAKSPRNLRRHTTRFLAMDEIDGYEVTQEGDPIKLAEMRTLTFRDRKILAGSTPIFDFGPITRLYGESDQRIYEVLCPECGGFHEIEWAQITWPEGQPDQAAWTCPGCGCVIEERHKPAMVAQGRWRATAPEVKGHAGFRINCLFSPHHNARWGKLAAEFLQAKRSPETLQPFVNTILGQPWKTEGEDFDEHELFRRREPFSLDQLPPEVLWLTCGVDCQDDRLELVIMGHGETDWLVLDHRVIWGPIDGEQVWQDLDSVLRETWKHPNGGTIKIDACAVDSGDGGHLEHVMGFCRSRFGRRVVPIKGVPGFSRGLIQKSGNQHLWLVGVDAAKSQLFARVSRSQGIRFSEALPPIFFEQFASERRIVRYVRGKPEARFERIKGKRAETLDASVYALAVRQLIGQRLDLRQAELASAAAPKAPPRVIKSAWMAR